MYAKPEWVILNLAAEVRRRRGVLGAVAVLVANVVDPPKRRWMRFSTRTALAVVAVVAAALGYAQWRRQAILREAAELESLGFTLQWEGGWTDQVWLRVPKLAAFRYYEGSDGMVRTAAGVYTEQEATLMYEDVCDRLHAIGVEEVRLDREGKLGNSYTSTLRMTQSD